jgi:hypothetical protein
MTLSLGFAPSVLDGLGDRAAQDPAAQDPAAQDPTAQDRAARGRVPQPAAAG